MDASSITSVGMAAQLLQLSPNRITALADALGISPVLINGIPHYSEPQITKISNKIRVDQQPAAEARQ